MIGAECFFSNKAAAKETLPTLPQYISRINTICEIELSEVVIPAVRPTVLIAEKVSIKALLRLTGSVAQIINVPPKASDRLIKVISKALFKNSFLMLLPNAVIPSLPRIEEKTKASITKSDVVFIPPAVELELPPMNIRKIVKSFDASEREAISTLLKPAVLGVTALKKLFKSFPPNDISSNNLLCSKIKNKQVLSNKRMAVTVITILLCKLSLLKRKRFTVMSSQTRKPKPPIIISAEITSITNGSLLKLTRELNGVGFPSRSNPALQNAETEWKTL